MVRSYAAFKRNWNDHFICVFRKIYWKKDSRPESERCIYKSSIGKNPLYEKYADIDCAGKEIRDCVYEITHNDSKWKS